MNQLTSIKTQSAAAAVGPFVFYSGQCFWNWCGVQTMMVPHKKSRRGRRPRARDQRPKKQKNKAQDAEEKAESGQEATQALEQPGRLKDILDTSTGQELPFFCDAIIVHVSDDFCKATLEEDDTEKYTHLTTIPGVYWLVTIVNNQLYFKQEPGENGAANNKQLVAWMDPQADGWFFGESYNEDYAESNIHMFVPCAECEHKLLPCAGKVHVPDPTADAVEGGVQICTLHAWHRAQIEAYANQTQHLQAEKEQPVHHNVHQIRKGWMTRCCELIIAVLKRDWAWATKCAWKLYGIGNMKDMVDKEWK